jgi:phosphoglycolate phosphatase-like HAD superfamily hydrolase
MEAMDCSRRVLLLAFAVAGLFIGGAAARPTASAADPLPSWNNGPAKQAIEAFVHDVTAPGPRFVPPAARVAVFDNDGTLWAEQPLYFELAFALDRAKAMAAKDPTLLQKPAFKAAASGDPAALAALSQKDVVELAVATHSGMTTDEFTTTAKAWFASAVHPQRHRPYVSLIYRPQVELLAYLRAHGFETWIVSGGGVDFMRAFAEAAYGVPPERTIGSSGQTRFEMRAGAPVLVKLPMVGSVDDGPGKPQNIELHIGRRPILAFGNSDGDQQMLEWTSAQSGPNLELLVHHDDSAREWAYDRKSKIGTLDKAWDEAVARHWIVVSMKND